MVKYLPDVLAEINADPEQVIKYIRKDAAITIILQHAFDPTKKFLLPEGAPEFKEDSAPIGLNPSSLRYEAKRLYVFTREDLKPLKREILFVQLLESLHPSEAKILLAIKDQNIESLYPNVNHKLMSQFGMCTYEEPKSITITDMVVPKSEDIVPEVIPEAVEEAPEQALESGSTAKRKKK